MSHSKPLSHERLTALGRLLSGVVHEINNPLNAILMNAELGLLYLEQTGETDKLRAILQTIAGEARSAGHTAQQVLDFARNDDYTPSGAQSLDNVLEDARKLLGSTLRRADVELQISADSQLPALPLNAMAISQALAGLAITAAEAGARKVCMTGAGERDHAVINISADQAFKSSDPLLERIVADHNGSLDEQAQGRRLIIRLPLV